MRLISQDGAFELPYETTTLNVEEKASGALVLTANAFDWTWARDSFHHIVLAEYETKEEMDGALIRMRIQYDKMIQSGYHTAYYRFPEAQ